MNNLNLISFDIIGGLQTCIGSVFFLGTKIARTKAQR